MANDALLDALEDENERLREDIARLKSLLGVNFVTPIEWRLTGAETRVFGVLMARELASKEQLLEAVGNGRIDGGPEIKIVDVFVCKARKKLEPWGLPIETRWGAGYFLTPETKARARALIEASASGVRAA